MQESIHIHPVFERMRGRSSKEAQLQQRGIVVWLYGLSGSGKSTLALALERKLAESGYLTQVLDGDNIRSGLTRDLSFSDEDRWENIRRIAEVAKLFLNAGMVTLTSFITPRRNLRRLARDIVGPADFLEVYVAAKFDTCLQRDPKGLYAKAQSGQVSQFTGKDSLFEEPLNPDLRIETEVLSIEQSTELLLQTILPRIRFPS